MNENLFPNSPPEPGQPDQRIQPDEPGVTEGRDLVEIPAFDLYRKPGDLSFSRVHRWQLREVGWRLSAELENLLWSGHDNRLKEGVDFYAGVLGPKGAAVFNDAMMQEIKSLGQKVHDAHVSERMETFKELRKYLRNARLEWRE